MRTRLELDTAFAPRDALSGYRSFFLVGIGGAGMSGIARMLATRGYTVKGTDLTDSELIHDLRDAGIQVHIGHTGSGLEEGDALVLSDAIDLNDSAEVRRARELVCKLFRRSQVLGWLLRDKKVIAITGTHGKTTTTGMLASGLRAAGVDPTIVVGAEVPQFGGAVVEGKGEWAVIEACEAYDSLRDFDPYVVLLTNLELDHVDFHENWENLRHAVVQFVDRVPQDGCLVYCKEDPGAAEIASITSARTVAYDMESFGAVVGEFGIHSAPALHGRHNLLNSAGAFVAIKNAGLDLGPAVPGVLSFNGASRRLQVMRTPDKAGGIAVVDDYAHHPTEIRASLQAIRHQWLSHGEEGRLVVVYQPHLYSRTKDLIPGFAEALSMADSVVLTDIYPAREDPIPGVSSLRISELITKPVKYVPSRYLLPIEVKALTRPGDVVVGMGAGNIADFAPAFIAELGPRVAVLYGGESAEREVSIHSGRAVHGALIRKGYDAMLVDATELLLDRGDVSKLVGAKRPDIAFLAIHGTKAEDGALQGFLEMIHLPYTGPGIRASAMAMDKELTKKLLMAAGLPVPHGVLLTNPDLQLVEAAGLKEASEWVVKPNAQGSTVGLSFVSKFEELEGAIEKALQYDSEVLVEDFIVGVEISVPVLGDRTFPAVEIVPDSGRYDFASKYVPGATKEICPARISDEAANIAKDYALRANKALGCSGVTRTDMIVTADKVVVLEINTLPGMTATSLVPRSAVEVGVSFDDLVEMILLEAWERYATPKA